MDVGLGVGLTRPAVGLSLGTVPDRVPALPDTVIVSENSKPPSTMTNRWPDTNAKLALLRVRADNPTPPRLVWGRTAQLSRFCRSCHSLSAKKCRLVAFPVFDCRLLRLPDLNGLGLRARDTRRESPTPRVEEWFLTSALHTQRLRSMKSSFESFRIPRIQRTAGLIVSRVPSLAGRPARDEEGSKAAGGQVITLPG